MTVRGMVVIALAVSLLGILGGVVVTAVDAPSATPTRASSDAADTLTPPPAPTLVSSEPAIPSGTQAPSPETTPDHSLPPLPAVATPELAALTTGLARTREYYGEAHRVGNFTIRWRPGAFPAAYAQEIAAIAEEALRTANARLGMQDDEPIEILLADQLFDDECVGCQGFAAADLRQVFILNDGSVAPDELPSLMTHEIGHVLALTFGEPHKLFFAEGLATWVSEPVIVESGYLSPVQTAAWAYAAGVLPSLEELRAARYEGRMRARVEYDGAASFAAFFIETYSLEAYSQLYALLPPEDVVGKDWATLEGEWHAYLERWAHTTVNGVDGQTWWSAAQAVIRGFQRVYDDPSSVSAEQWAALSQARIELNRANVPAALALATYSGLTGTAS